MNGIRLYDQSLRLKERSGSGNTGSTSVEVPVPPQPAMGPPPLMPPSLRVARPSFVGTGHPPSFNHNVSGSHAGLLRSSSEPEGLGTNWHKSQRPGNVAHDRERSAVPYFRPQVHQGPGQMHSAQNIASQLFMLNRANAVLQRSQQFDARTPHSYFHRHQNHHEQFNDRSGFRRR